MTVADRVLLILAGELAVIRKLDPGDGSVLQVVAEALIAEMPGDSRRQIIRKLARAQAGKQSLNLNE